MTLKTFAKYSVSRALVQYFEKLAEFRGKLKFLPAPNLIKILESASDANTAEAVICTFKSQKLLTSSQEIREFCWREKSEKFCDFLQTSPAVISSTLMNC
jgi:hypothetical protein